LPYSQTSLDQYHLGLYALSGSLQLIADIPAHTALLWMAQALNGLCVIGVFLFLDRKVSRLAGLIGMVAVGLLSFQPAWYVNWGRFTQISSQAVLLISAVITWETVAVWREEWSKEKIQVVILALLAAILIAGVFLLHFRVAGNLLPLLILIVFVEFIRSWPSKKDLLFTGLGVTLIVLFSIILISPALIPAINVYFNNINDVVLKPIDAQSQSLANNPYHTAIDFLRIRVYGIKPWLMSLSLAGAVVGLWRKNRTLTIVIILWVILLFLEGIAYTFNIPLLAFTNAFEVIIMFYIPASLLVGILIEQIFLFVGQDVKSQIMPVFLWLIIFSGFIGAHYRITEIADSRYLMTKQDQQAMTWIKNNTPEDAVFAIHTHFWLPNAVHGSDGGYWIPYFTGRQTTTDTMIASLGPGYDIVLERSNAVLALYEKDPSVNELCALAVGYVYDGAKGSFDGKSFDINALKNLPGVEMIYDIDGVTILKICD